MVRYGILLSLAIAHSLSIEPVLAANPAEDEPVGAIDCQPLPSNENGTARRVVCADIAALDQVLIYNRCGSFNPFGMIFALRRDLTAADTVPQRTSAADCDQDTGVDKALAENLTPGNVRLKDCKRPRPIVLRANVGDLLHVRVSNYLHAGQPGVSETFCRQAGTPPQSWRAALRNAVSEGDELASAHQEVTCQTGSGQKEPSYTSDPMAADWPRTRAVNFSVQGLIAIPNPYDGVDDEPARRELAVCRGLDAIDPGDSVDCFFEIDRVGPYFIASNAAPAGGEGDGGSITHGLFGSVVVQEQATEWYRSQVSQSAFDAAWPRAPGTVRHARQGTVDYEHHIDGVPVLNLLMRRAGGAGTATGIAAYEPQEPAEIVHADLNAIIYRPGEGSAGAMIAGGQPSAQAQSAAPIGFREFSVFFHDELKTKYTRNFEELGQFGQLAGVRDGFAINYGASGMGALLLANRKRIGPAADCPECLYEEFFLTSWANGDPALLERYVDDPSNVHHSYLNDEIKFRNFHAGPKETHVFHLHAHQWFAGNDPDRGSYLDSQTVAPQQGFTYDIYHGGLRREGDGSGSNWWDSRGAGNRNRSPGDSIFHCHLYPHFAQGMWELWRNHDVLEDGTRRLPDGQAHEGLSLVEAEQTIVRRSGSVDLDTGRWIENAAGTPVPAVVPVPGQPTPLLPTYAGADSEPGQTAEGNASMPGYPYYIAGRAGHRPPQAPMDIARALRDMVDGENASLISTGDYLDAGLPRHTVNDGGTRHFPVAKGITLDEMIGSPEREKQMSQLTAKMLAMGDMTAELEQTEVKLIPYDGTALERAAMGFHYDGTQWGSGVAIDTRSVDGSAAPFQANRGGYGQAAAPQLFAVNGAPPKPGAPFADPCGIPTGLGQTPEPSATYPGAPGAVMQGTETDPFVPDGLGAYPPGFIFRADPHVSGFRRYEASAVQLDIITNRAGWHDPQARINVLTALSDRYKDNNSGLDDPISPFVSAREEPFFFRALSGECIEFRHTNEVPKDLELDDFQVRTPTDTIGQHIHLVKFDVTSSDGSGNGWNYEDGTFAPDEITARICAAKTAGMTINATRASGELALSGGENLCKAKTDEDGQPVLTASGDTVWVPTQKGIWKLKRGEHPQRFQTTVQRWFADPILSEDSKAELQDRTMRTVFTHDHFGASSIQQHGFYSALVIEPANSIVCRDKLDGGNADCSEQREAGNRALAEGLPVLTGVKRVVLDMEQAPTITDAMTPIERQAEQEKFDKTKLHRDYREFALAIADFSLLYDPRDTKTETQTRSDTNGKGMATIACESQWRSDPAKLVEQCGSALALDGQDWVAAPEDVPPAWLAMGRPGDSPHSTGLLAMVDDSDTRQLWQHLVDYRRRAALSDTSERLAAPVNAPARPESISVDHHDPYLINYRGEPIPLRVGTKLSAAADPASASSDCALKRLPEQGTVASDSDNDSSLVADASQCSIARQRDGEPGDMSNVFLSSLHGDPATPLLETYSGDRTMIRLIQGAQEVQHMFNVEGYTWKRNIDQSFAQAAKQYHESYKDGDLTLNRRCNAFKAVRDGRPREYDEYFRRGAGVFDPDPTSPTHDPHLASTDAFAFFTDFDARQAECLNIEGYTTAQEIGISEHFELRGSFRQSISNATLRSAPGVARTDAAEPPGDLVDRRRFATDYLYDFGTVDSFWNGAWGQLRVYRDAGAPDYTECLAASDGSSPAQCNAAGPAIRNRLAPINALKQMAGAGLPIGGGGGGGGGDSPGLGRRSGEQAPLASEIIGCPADAPKVTAAVAAIEARKVFGHIGMQYGNDMHDPDGLMLAALDPDQLNAAMQRPNSRRKVEKLVRDQYRQQAVEPYVLRVNAGDCVRLTVVNLLEAESGRAGLRDGAGDARMPSITTLNVEAADRPGEWAVTGEGQPEGLTSRVLEADANAPRRHELRPSARLALRFPLPTLNDTQRISLPFGLNATAALSPAGSRLSFGEEPREQDLGPGGYLRNRDSVETVTFYAGKSWLEMSAARSAELLLQVGQAVAAVLAADNGIEPELRARLVGLFDGTSGRLNKLTRSEFDSDAFEFLGEQYQPEISGTPLANLLQLWVPTKTARVELLTRLQSLWTTSAATELGKAAHWMPYAFGAMPIKSFGDAIGHGVHGLMGAINVVPQNWDLQSAGRLPVGAAASNEFRIVPTRIASGHGVSINDVQLTADPLPDGSPGQTTEHQIREFVVFYQDGLNLHDRRSNGHWHWSNDLTNVRDADGRHLKPAPDCRICDDSYDRGDRGVSYHSAPFHSRLRVPGSNHLEADGDLNAEEFPAEFFKLKPDEQASGPQGLAPPKDRAPMPVLRAEADDEVVIRVLQPNGRARQHAFVTIAQDYDDLFPGFGFPHSALMAPGKSLTAALTRPVKTGCYLWHDGPTHLRAGGIWGLLDVVPQGALKDASQSSCRRG